MRRLQVSGSIRLDARGSIRRRHGSWECVAVCDCWREVVLPRPQAANVHAVIKEATMGNAYPVTDSLALS